MRKRLKPSDSAASTVVRGTASMPERKISTLKAPAKNDSDRIAQRHVADHGIVAPEASTLFSRLPTPK